MMHRKPHVLLVEDEQRLAQYLSLELQDIGYEVTVAADGRSGMLAARQQTFDLVLLDWQLPRYSGLEVCRWLRQRPKAPPILMVTAYNSPERVKVAHEAGVSGYLVKPFDVDKLMDLICRLLPESCIEFSLA